MQMCKRCAIVCPVRKCKYWLLGQSTLSLSTFLPLTLSLCLSLYCALGLVHISFPVAGLDVLLSQCYTNMRQSVELRFHVPHASCLMPHASSRMPRPRTRLPFLLLLSSASFMCHRKTFVASGQSWPDTGHWNKADQAQGRTSLPQSHLPNYLLRRNLVINLPLNNMQGIPNI